MRISSLYYSGFVAVTHISAAFLCRVTFVFQSRFASPNSWSKIDAPALMACLKKLQERLCDAIQRCSYIKKFKIETLKLPLLVCRPFLGRSILREKKNKQICKQQHLNNRGLLISDEKEKECEEVVCPITQYCVRGVCVCLPGKFC